jgi:hypothetical protein
VIEIADVFRRFADGYLSAHGATKLVEAAQRSWRRLDGHALLPKLILGVKFADGLEVVPKNTGAQPNVSAA